MKKFLFLMLATSIATAVFAKKKVITNEQIPVNKTEHYIGLQANYLMREFFNFGGSNINLTNPYGIVYHINSKRNGVGLRVGLGPNIYNRKNIDGFATIESKGYDLSTRVGFDKRFIIDNRWEAGAGFDILFNIQKDETKNDQINTQGFISETRTEQIGFGGGPMGYLRYRIRPNILIGTESGFYFVMGKNKNKSKISNLAGNILSESDDNDDFMDGNLNLPISIFLFIKF